MARGIFSRAKHGLSRCGLANMRPSYKVSFIEDPEQIAFTARRVLRVDAIVANEPGSE